MTTRLTLIDLIAEIRAGDNDRFAMQLHNGQSLYTEYLVIGPNEIYLSTQHEYDNGTPMSVWNGVERRVDIMHPLAYEFADLLEEHSDTLRAIMEGAASRWDGNNHVGNWSDDATAAWMSLFGEPYGYNTGSVLEGLTQCEYANDDWYEDAAASFVAIPGNWDLTKEEIEAEAAALSDMEFVDGLYIIQRPADYATAIARALKVRASSGRFSFTVYA